MSNLPARPGHKIYRHPGAVSDTTILVPCYNEALRLDTKAFAEFADVHPEFRFLFVDDGSTDATLEILTNFCMSRPTSFDVLALEENGGKAEAVRQGLSHATKTDAKFIGFMDADLATPLEALVDFHRIVTILDGVDVVFGSRKQTLGHRIKRDLHRRIISFVCSTMARFATGLPISDTQCGAKLFRNTTSLKAVVAEPFETGWLFDVELFLRLSGTVSGSSERFFEHALMQWDEIPGSNVSSKDIVMGGLVMLKLISKRAMIKRKFRRLSDQHFIQSFEKLSLSGDVSLADMSALRERTSSTKEHVTINLASVRTISGPAMMSLFALCADIEYSGRRVRVLFCDDRCIVDAAKRCGLTSLFDCSIVEVPIASNDNLELSVMKAA